MMSPAYATKLGLTTQKTSIRAQKINDSSLKTYDMISASFLLQDSLGKVQFFEETFLLTDTNMEMVLAMCFLSLSNADIKLAELEKLTWSLNTAVEALPITSRVGLINKKEFAKVVMDENLKTFVVYMSALDITESSIHPSQVALIATLLWNNALTKIPSGYFYYANVFSSDLAMELPENTGMNEFAIELIVGKQPPYKPI